MKLFVKSVTNRWVDIVILLLVAAVVILAGPLAFPSDAIEPSPLDAVLMGTLREKYPEMPREYDAMVDIMPFDIAKQIKWTCHAYVLAEVVERLDDSTNSLSMSLTEGVDPALLAEKEKNLGFPLPDLNVEQVYENYRLRIVDILYQGDGIEVLDPSLAVSIDQVLEARSCVYNSFLGGVFPLPDMRPGRLFIIGLSIGKQEGLVPSGYQFDSNGLYYIVDKTHVISAYREVEPHVYSGLPILAFKQTIQDIRDTHTELDDRLREIRKTHAATLSDQRIT